MPKILYVYQKQEQKYTNNKYTCNENTFKVWGKNIEGRINWNPRWGQNVIDKVWVCGNLKQLNETFDKYKI